MSSYIPSSENGRDSTPMLYLREPLQDSYPSEPPILTGNVMTYMNFPPSSAGEFSSTLAGPSINLPNIGIHNFSENHEMMLMDQMGSSSSRNLLAQGQLSLSLGSHIPVTGIQFSGHRPESSSVHMLPDFSVSNYGYTNVSRGITDSKYLKPAQNLLDEIVNVAKSLKQKESKNAITDQEPESEPEPEPNELSVIEKQELQNKVTKLITMLDEVDRRYKQYYHQMQIVVAAFDVIAGGGAARPYTALALQTISRHFRCLRDAINNQIKSCQRCLGETDGNGNGNRNGVGISRLRFVDQKLRQQRALQQLGMMQQHTWRPQRGLPESSVSVLRAWLFEHFLHPYPKDSDKIMLARQTGLTRSQVSNWFINARVRLWKPMVEEMYKEEAGEREVAGMESNSSSEIGKGGGDRKISGDDQEDMNRSSSPNQAHEIEMVGTSGELMAAAAVAYQIPGRFNVGGGGVSLTLGLQHCEDGGLASIGNHHHGFVDIRGGGGGGGGVYDVGGGSSETVDFDDENSGNGQQRFGSSHLLRDFVA